MAQATGIRMLTEEAPMGYCGKHGIPLTVPDPERWPHAWKCVKCMEEWMRKVRNDDRKPTYSDSSDEHQRSSDPDSP